MSGIILALTIGFLLGVLLMVILSAAWEDERLVERVDQLETSRRLPVNGSDQPAGTVKRTSGAERSG